MNCWLDMLGPQHPARKLAPAVFLSDRTRLDLPPGPDNPPLWNLTGDVPGHRAGSTVSESVLRRLGYRLPDRTERLCVSPSAIHTGYRLGAGRPGVRVTRRRRGW